MQRANESGDFIVNYQEIVSKSRDYQLNDLNGRASGLTTGVGLSHLLSPPTEPALDMHEHSTIERDTASDRNGNAVN